jgi:hypothetical protein
MCEPWRASTSLAEGSDNQSHSRRCIMTIGSRDFYFFSNYDVAIVATIHKRKEPNLATDQRGQ